MVSLDSDRTTSNHARAMRGMLGCCRERNSMCGQGDQDEGEKFSEENHRFVKGGGKLMEPQ